MNKNVAYKWLIFLMMMTSSFVVLQAWGRTFFLLLQVVFCGILLCSEKKLHFLKSRTVNFFFISYLLCTFSSYISNIPYSYKKAAVIMAIYMIPLYFTISYLYSMFKKDEKILQILVKGLKAMCMIQLIWVLLQYVVYNFIGLDINQKIFVEILKCVDNASFIRDWKWYPSGLSWHSAILAPMFVIAFVLFKNIYVRVLIIIDAFICGNSTAVVGVCLCILILLFFYLSKNKDRITIRKKQLALMGIIAVIGGSVAYKMGLFELVITKFVFLLQRIFASQKDASTAAHFAYFTDYDTVLKNSTLLQFLFGYGQGCSGYPYSVLYNRYTDIANWAVECDVINILVSRGLYGFITHYYLLFYICFKGIKIDYRYAAVVIPIIIQGIGYNVQWDYIIFVELILFLTIRLKINFFDINNKNALIDRKEKRNGFGCHDHL